MSLNVSAKGNNSESIRKIFQQLQIQISGGFVPYTGATKDVNLGVYDLSSTDLTSTSLTASTFAYANAAKKLVSLANSAGFLKNNGTGTFTYDTILGLSSLVDPDADRIPFWDDSETSFKWLSCGNSLAITTTTLDTIQDIRTSASPSFLKLTSTQVTGTAPFTIASTTVCTNLNADMVDGKHSTDILLLNQTSPQTITGGVPLMTSAVDSTGSGTQLVNKNYVDLAVSSLQLNEFFANTTLSPAVGTFLTMDSTQAGASTVTSPDITGTTGSPTAMFKFMTVAGEPHLDRFLEAIYESHIHLLKTMTGNKVVAVRFNIWQNDAAGAHTALLVTSGWLDGLTDSSLPYEVIGASSSETSLATTDRLSVEWEGYVVSGAGTCTVTMAVGGTADSHVGIGIHSAELDQIFVPYTGSTHDTTLGTYKLTGNNFVSSVATGTQPYACTSTTVNTNLNSDLWDGYQFSDYLDQAVKQASTPTFAGLNCGNILPSADNTYYLGKNSISTPLAYKAIILKDQTLAKYWRIEVDNGALQITEIT